MTSVNNVKHGQAEVQVKLQSALLSFFGDKISIDPSLAWKEYGLCVRCEPLVLTELMTSLKTAPEFSFSMLIDVTCVDYLDSRPNRYEVVYQLFSYQLKHRLCVKVSLPESEPVIPSIRALWSAANFLEREVFDLFGINFEGHGDLRRILMYDEFVGHPLRKDYPLRGKQPRVKLRVPELRNTSADLQREALVSLPTRRG